MSKTRYYLIRIGISSGVGMVIYLLVQLLLALLIVKGMLGEGRVTGFQIIAGGIGAFLSGCLAVKLTKWAPAATITGILMAVATVLLGVGVYDGIIVSADTLVRISVMLVGGALPTLLLRKKGRRHTGAVGGRRMRRT